MRPRFKITGLVSHTTPRYSIQSEESKLRKKFTNGTINEEELHRLACFVAVLKKKNVTAYTQVRIFGKWTLISKLGIDVNFLIKEGYTVR